MKKVGAVLAVLLVLFATATAMAYETPINFKAVKPDGKVAANADYKIYYTCLLYTSPSPRDLSTSRMPSSA
mgnify:CR=1 FL=1